MNEEMRDRYADALREVAFLDIATEHNMPVLPTEYGAQVPPHWSAEADNKADPYLDAVLAVRDAEVERLSNVEFEHAGCRMLREKDNTYLIERAEAAEARLAAVEALIADGPEKWRGYDTHDIGHAFLADAVLDWVDDLRRALASVPAVDAGDREPASEGERVADGVVWEFVDGDWREKPCRTCSGSGDAPSSAGIVTDCSDCEGSGYTIPVSEAVRAAEPRSGAPEATGTFGGFEAVTEAHSDASEVQP